VVTTDTAEAHASDRAAAEDTEEIAASAGAAGAEIVEAGANTANAITETAEDKASDESAASDVKEAGTSISAAAADATESTANVTNALTGSAESASKIQYVGWAIALGILALAGVAAGFAIANMNGAFDNEKGAEKKAENINNLSGEIYKLTERARALDQITDSFDAIDEKVIKTKKDMEEMNSLLEKAGDELSDEIEDDEDIGYGKGVSAKEAYEQLSRQEDKINFLKAEADRNRQLANEKRKEQLAIFNSARTYEKDRLLHGTEAQYVTARSAIYGINNNTLYEHVDALKSVEGADAEALAATEELVQSMLNELDVETALAVANEKNGETIKELAGRMADMPATEDFLNEDKSILERVNAYKELSGALAGNKEMLDALKAAYSE
jgi:hypothetical protein